MRIPNAETLAYRVTRKYERSDDALDASHTDVVTAANRLVLEAYSEGLDLNDTDEIEIDVSGKRLTLVSGDDAQSVWVEESDLGLETPFSGQYSDIEPA
ncbi:hypothetical protein GGP62_002190 [Salinibacter ruber]|uniref:hypothetical protein n=1 Tax=Salinibacter ruber TaxID=146919 RepID=UPI00216793A1|nr:hypothetical protein [Salinibacter ruber]MCS3707203.1 hypothetical protein [Salinibacter ruber]